MRLLVTGFGPFADIIENPSEEYAKSIRIEDCEITVKILSVNEKGLGEFLAFLDASPQFDAIIMLGLAASSDHIRIELLATNIFRESNSGHEVSECKSECQTLLTTCDMAKIPWVHCHPFYSYDAGTYYCNRLYYSVLERIYWKRIVRGDCRHYVPALFIHVPLFERLSFKHGLAHITSIIEIAIA